MTDIADAIREFADKRRSVSGTNPPNFPEASAPLGTTTKDGDIEWKKATNPAKRKKNKK